MHLRTALSLFLCLSTLGVGVFTVFVTSKNRARAKALNERQRWCEVFSRQNELLRAEVYEKEWGLISGEEETRVADLVPRTMVER